MAKGGQEGEKAGRNHYDVTETLKDAADEPFRSHRNWFIACL